MTPAPPRSGGRRLLQALLVLSVLFPATIFVIGSVIGYRSQEADDRVRLLRTTDIVYEHAQKVFETQELVIRNIEGLIAGFTDAEIVADEARLHRELQKRIGGLPQIQDAYVIDKTGRAMVSVQTFPMPVASDFTDRDYFRAELERPQLYVSGLLTGRLGGQHFFNVAIRRTGSDGAFDGVVLVSVNLDYFEEFYRRVQGEDAERHYAIAMARSQGDLLVRYPPTGNVRAPASPAFHEQTEKFPEKGFYEAVSPGDGNLRMVAYRRLAAVPVYVWASVPRNSVDAAWLATLAPNLLFGIPATIALFVVTLVALRRTERETAALALAAQEAEGRRIAEAALQQSQKMEAVGQLTGGIAHDFNNLLHAVLGNLDLVETASDLDKAKRHAAAAQRATERGAQLTSRLLAFARRQDLHTETVDVNALLREFAALADHAVGKAVRLELSLDPAQPKCKADAPQLEAALLNLAINARDALQDASDRVIRIATRMAVLTAEDLAGNADAAPGKFVAIAVSDAGAGMDSDVARRAFEPFFTTKEVGKGTGLGLSQVYGFVHQLGGHVDLETAPGQGTTVTLYLPEADEPSPTVEPEAAAVASDAASAAILVVDDDPDVREITEASLRMAGHLVLSAGDGRAAVAIIESGATFDLLLSDVVMPNGIGGIKLARRARILQPGIAVLLMSGYAAAEIAEAGATADEFEMLAKPFATAELLARIEASLGARGARR